MVVGLSFLWICLGVGALVSVIASIIGKYSTEQFLMALIIIEAMQVLFWLFENVIYWIIK